MLSERVVNASAATYLIYVLVEKSNGKKNGAFYHRWPLLTISNSIKIDIRHKT